MIDDETPPPGRKKVDPESMRKSLTDAIEGRLGEEGRLADNTPFAREDNSELLVLAQNLRKINYVAMIDRPGVRRWMFELEHSHYDPKNKELNDEFELRILLWADIEWIVVTVPIDKRAAAETLLAKHGLAAKLGHPVMLSNEGRKDFPLTGKTVHTLENTAEAHASDAVKKANEAAIASLLRMMGKPKPGTM